MRQPYCCRARVATPHRPMHRSRSMFDIHRRHRVWLAAVPSLLVLSACADGGDAARDTAAAAPAATAGPGANPVDTGMTAGTHDMAGMNHGAMANRAAPRDSNESFLRMMSDHHQGLVAMSDTAMGKLGAAAR